MKHFESVSRRADAVAGASTGRSGSGGGMRTGAGDSVAGDGVGAGGGARLADEDGAADGGGELSVAGSGSATGVGVAGFSAGSGSVSFSRRKRRKRDIGPARAETPSLLRRGGPPHMFFGRRYPSGMPSSPTERLRELGIALPPPPKPAGTYSPVVRDGTRLWVSGQIVTEQGKVVRPGLVDRDVAPETARDLARRASLQALSALAAELGSLDHVKRFLRVTVYVASSPGFDRQHEVANGATEILVQVFGEASRPARVAVGVAGLPLNAPVEVDFLAGTD